MSRTALDDDVKAFLADQERLEGRGDLSPATVTQRRFSLSIFLEWADTAKVKTTADVNAKALESFEAWLGARRHRATGKPLSRETKRSYLRAVQPFLASVKAPTGNYKPPKKAPYGQRATLDRQEIDRLERAATDERDRLIVRLLGDCGLRVQELLDLKPSDLQEDKHGRVYSIRIVGKGDKERLVPVLPAVFKRLRHYVDHGRPVNDASYIFMGRRKRHDAVTRLTRSGVDQLVRNLAITAKIGRRVHPHLLRHSAISNLLAQNMNPIVVARMVGHANLDQIMQTYGHLRINETYDQMVAALR